jgi:hypothetical protein
MQNDDDDVLIEYEAEEQRLFAALPREEPIGRGDADRAVQRLRREGLLVQPVQRWSWALGAVAAVLLLAAGLAAGIVAGERIAQRNSLEQMLARRDLTVAERVLLLQRAGSAYVHAAQGYADATARVDASAVEVASKVLMGAAHAVARNGLDAGLAARLTTALAPTAVTPVSAVRKPVIWY